MAEKLEYLGNFQTGLMTVVEDGRPVGTMIGDIEIDGSHIELNVDYQMAEPGTERQRLSGFEDVRCDWHNRYGDKVKIADRRGKLSFGFSASRASWPPDRGVGNCGYKPQQ